MTRAARTQSALVHVLRQLKHQLYRARRWLVMDGRSWGRDQGGKFRTTLFPPRFSPGKYAGTFVDLDSSGFDLNETSAVPRRIYCCWFGPEAMTPNRIESLASLRASNPDLEIVLVTAENLGALEHPNWPIHPAFRHLSAIHKSDYLRCYLLHLYGGGYADIKRYSRPWRRAFEICERDESVVLVGYREQDAQGAATLPGTLGRDLKTHFHRLAGSGAFVCRSGSDYTRDWFAELHRRLDLNAAELALHPGDTWGKNDGYPIQWVELMGEITHPLQLKHLRSLRYCPDVRPSFSDYR